MRVISGKLKGRNIKGYNIDGTRPTMDRVKSSLFASIQDFISGALVLDLFAGSGNLGIEAISNGCSSCYFVDNNKKCIKVIYDNLKSFDILDQGSVIEGDYLFVLNDFKKKKMKFDIIFVDPPYSYQIMNDMLKECYDILNDDGIIVLEYQNDIIYGVYEEYQLLKYKKYGDKYISIYKKNKTNN